MLLQASQKDRLVRATDIDALSCKFWANQKGYFVQKDRFIAPLIESYKSHLRYCEGYTNLSAERTLRRAFNTPKFPLINRGTYLRTHAIDVVTERFIEEHRGKCQVVALGGGSDTRVFRVLEKHPQVRYSEVDFPESVTIKKLAIAKLSDLLEITGYPENEQATYQKLEISSKKTFAAIDPAISTPRYTLVPFDLRLTVSHGAETFKYLDRELPTLVVSECVLCYLGPEDFVSVLKFWKDFIPQVACVLFDPMSLGDAFGEAMTSNLSNRGIDLQTFRAFPTLETRKILLENQLHFKAHLTDVAAVGGFGQSNQQSDQLSWLSLSETKRVSRLEMMDEVEEITLMLRHYSLIYAESNMLLLFVLQLPWIL